MWLRVPPPDGTLRPHMGGPDRWWADIHTTIRGRGNDHHHRYQSAPSQAHIVLSQPARCSRSLNPPLREGALICDVSRPFNLAPDLAQQRADLRLLSGALLLPPPSSVLGHVEAPERGERLGVPAQAETMC